MIDLRKNKKTVGEVISEGILTIEEILEYAQQYKDAMDAFDENYEPDFEDDCYMTEEEMKHEKMNLLYDEMNNYEPIWLNERPDNPEYIIASTSYRLNETYIFYANQNGEIMSTSEYGVLAERFEDSNWESHRDAVNTVFDSSYELVWEKTLQSISGKLHHALYKKSNYVVE